MTYRLTHTFRLGSITFDRPVTRAFARWYLINREGYSAKEL